MLREMMKNPKNMRPNPELPLIVETDASKKAVGASLIQEIPKEDGTKEKVMIYAASRSFKSAETRYSTIRRELLAVVFAVQKFRRFLIVRDFLIRTHQPLPDETSYALDLYTYVGKIYLSILHLKSESFWSLEVPEKTRTSWLFELSLSV